MGAAKNLMMERDDLAGAALRVLLKVGALKACEVHGELSEGNSDLEGAYKLGNTMISRGDIDLGGFSRTEFSALIKSEFDDHSYGDGCGYCHKLMRD